MSADLGQKPDLVGRAGHPAIPISENPAAGLQWFRARGTRGGDGMIRVVSRDEVFSLSDAMKMLEYSFANSNRVLAHMLETAFLTGMRRGELCGVKAFQRRLNEYKRQHKLRDFSDLLEECLYRGLRPPVRVDRLDFTLEPTAEPISVLPGVVSSGTKSQRESRKSKKDAAL